MGREIWKWVLGLSLVAGAGNPVGAAEERAENGLYSVLVNGKFGYADARGVMVIRPQFDQARNFVEGLACVVRDGRWGYMNAAGRMVIEPKYEWAFDFSGGLARVGSGFEVDYVNQGGQSVGLQRMWLAQNPSEFAVDPSRAASPSTSPPLASIPAMP